VVSRSFKITSYGPDDVIMRPHMGRLFVIYASFSILYNSFKLVALRFRITRNYVIYGLYDVIMRPDMSPKKILGRLFVIYGPFSILYNGFKLVALSFKITSYGPYDVIMWPHMGIKKFFDRKFVIHASFSIL